jgi:hypothetical protein
MQYQTKWMTNILKLLASRQSSLIRTLLVVGLLIGCLGIALVGLQQSLLNAQARPATPQQFGQARSVSITVSSHINQQTVTYTLTVHTGTHAGTIRRGIPITFTDSIPVGLSHISAKGNLWDTKVNSKIGPSLVTGTYKGSYPIGPGVTLPAVIIQGTINHHASNVLTNSASVNVWGNTDKHSKAIVSDNIQPTLSSQPFLNSNDNSSICDISCDISDKNACNKQCSPQVSHDCNNQCAQASVHTSIQEKVHISVQESESIDTSCGCSQQSTDGSGTSTSNSNGKYDTSDKGSTSPFPALPNTGSDPNYK